MSGTLNSRQWRDQIQSRKAEGGSVSYVAALQKQRSQEGHKKPDAMDWRQYVEMRRGNSGADGKSRSKGHPEGTAPKRSGGITHKGRSYLLPTQLREASRIDVGPVNARSIQVEQAAKKAAKSVEHNPLTRRERLVGSYQESARHLSRIAERKKPQVPDKSKQPSEPKTAVTKPRSNASQVADHAAKQRKAGEAARMAKQQTKAKAKAAVPPPPTPKR